MTTADWLNPQNEVATRQALHQRLLRDLHLGQYGTSTDVTVGYIEDTNRLLNVAISPESMRGAWVRLVTDNDEKAASPYGEIRPVLRLEPRTGRLYVDPPLSSVPGDTTADYEIWRRVHPQDVIDVTNRVLQEEIYLPYWEWLSELPGGDFEDALDDEVWEAIGGAAGTIVSFAAGASYQRSRYGLRIVTTGAGDGYGSQSVQVRPGAHIHVSAELLLITPELTSFPRLVVYDDSDDSEIASITIEEGPSKRYSLDFTVPSDVSRIYVATVAGDATEVYWRISQVILQDLDARSLPLPRWIKNADQVKGVFRSQLWSRGGNTFDPEMHGTLDPHAYFVDNAFSFGQLRIQRRVGTFTRPYYIFASRNESSYVYDNDRKRIDPNHLFTAVADNLMTNFVMQPSTEMDRQQFVAMAAKLSRDHEMYRRAQEVRLSNTYVGREPEVFVADVARESLYYGEF